MTPDQAPNLSVSRAAEPDARHTGRARGGRWMSRFTDLEWLAIVAKVALLAAERTKHGDPLRVTQNQWYAATGLVFDKHGGVGSAHGIKAHLEKAAKRKLSWRELLRIALSKGDIDRIWEHEVRGDRTLPTLPKCKWAGQYISKLLGTPTLTTLDYAHGIEKAVELHGEHMRSKFPTVGQVLTCCGTWDEFLELCELESRPEHFGPEPGTPLHEAVVYHCCQRGHFPSGTGEAHRVRRGTRLFDAKPQRTRLARHRREGQGPVGRASLHSRRLHHATPRDLDAPPLATRPLATPTEGAPVLRRAAPAPHRVQTVARPTTGDERQLPALHQGSPRRPFAQRGT